MITYYYGVPRSGKTLGAIKSCVDATGLSPSEFAQALRFGGKDHLDDCLRKHGQYAEIYHNIEGFKAFNDISGDEVKCLLHDWESEPVLRRLLIIDECHRFLDKPSTELVHFFAYHGHFGFDLILITQSPFLIPRKLTVLGEMEKTAVRRSFRFANELRYSIGAAGEKTGFEVIKNPKQYFSLYKSATLHKAPKRQLTKFALVLGVFVLLAFGALGFTIQSFASKGNELPRQSISKTPSPRERAGAPASSSAQNYQRDTTKEWQLASVVTIEDNGQVSRFIVDGKVLKPLELYLREGTAVRSGRDYFALLPINEKESEGTSDGFYNN